VILWIEFERLIAYLSYQHENICKTNTTLSLYMMEKDSTIQATSQVDSDKNEVNYLKVEMGNKSRRKTGQLGGNPAHPS
jgi:hypothetical protein